MLQSALICTFVWVFVQGLDRLISWQTLQRPIVAATLTGLLLGDFQTGLIMGASLEAIFMGISAIGGSLPSDGCSSSIIAVAYAVLTGADIETGIALAMPIGTIMGSVNEMWKPILASLAPHWERLASEGKVKAFRAQIIACGLFVDRLPMTIVLFAAIAFGVQGLEQVMNSLPAFILSGVSAAGAMMTAVGFAILLSMIWNGEIGCFFFIGFVLYEYLELPTMAIAIIAGATAITYFFIEKKFTDLKKLVEEGGNAGMAAADEEDLF